MRGAEGLLHKRERAPEQGLCRLVFALRKVRHPQVGERDCHGGMLRAEVALRDLERFLRHYDGAVQVTLSIQGPRFLDKRLQFVSLREYGPAGQQYAEANRGEPT